METDIKTEKVKEFFINNKGFYMREDLVRKLNMKRWTLYKILNYLTSKKIVERKKLRDDGTCYYGRSI